MAVTITSMGTTVTKHSFQYDASKTQSGLQNALQSVGNRNCESSYTFGTASGLYINQVIVGTVTLAGGATTDYNVSTGLTLSNVVGATAPSLTVVKEFWLELLSAAQTDDAGTAGSATSSITCGNDGGAPWDSGPLGATDTYKLLNGDKWIHVSNATAGMSVSSGDILQIVNNDGAVAAKIRYTWLGLA